MATAAWLNPYVEINSVDYTDHVKSATLTYGAEILDDTASGDDTRSGFGGLKTWNLALELLNDFADDDVDERLFALVGVTTTVTLRRTTAAASVSNPSYSGTGILGEYPIGGAIGDMDTTSISFQSAGTLARATA
jgi:hypothetical protein